MAICLKEVGKRSVGLEKILISEKVYVDENIWINVANILAHYPDINQIPIYAEDGSILYLAEDNPKIDELMMKLCELAKDNQIWKEVPAVHIKGMNEILFYLEKLLVRKGVPVSVEGDLWEKLGISSVNRGSLPDSQIVEEDGAWISQLYARWKREKNVWNRERWDDLCKDIKEKNETVAFCAMPGATSELIYDALLQKEIIPEIIVCPDRFRALFGRSVTNIYELSGALWCLAGAREDARMNIIFEEVVRKERGLFEKIYLLSGIERILPDAMLYNMIRYCGKVVLMGEKRVCDLLKKYCIELGKIEVTYVENIEQMVENVNKGMESLWFYLDFPSEEAVNRFKKAAAECMQEGLYLSRYFLNHYMFYRDEYNKACFTYKETIRMKCLKQMQALVDGYSADYNKQNKSKYSVLFTASHLSYLWDGIAPLFEYYTKRVDIECIVMFSSIWDILRAGDRNLKETASNISEIIKLGGKVFFSKNWYPDRKFDVCFTSLGFSDWYEKGREVSKLIVSLQTTGYHTHYYIGNQKFEDMFSERQREEIDYAIVSTFMAAWAEQREEKWKDKLLPFGYPRMDRLYENIHNCDIPDEWKTKIEGKKVIYFTDFQSTVFKYCLEYCKKGKMVLIWRPHPYDFDSPGTRERIEGWKNKENVIIDTNQSYNIAFNVSDALVTSFSSSVQINYLFTDKPVLILNKKFWKWGENEVDFQEEAWYKAAYAANDEKACREFVDMIIDGRDDKKEEKLPYRRFMQQGFDGRVCERIAKFIDGKIEKVIN